MSLIGIQDSYRIFGPVFGRRVLESWVADLVLAAELLPQQVDKRVVHPEGRIRGRTTDVCHVTYTKFKPCYLHIPINAVDNVLENILRCVRVGMLWVCATAT